MGPSCGTSWIRSMERMWSRVSMDGERPPWRQKICCVSDNPISATPSSLAKR